MYIRKGKGNVKMTVAFYNVSALVWVGFMINTEVVNVMENVNVDFRANRSHI